MNLQGTIPIEAPPEAIWQLLMDPMRLCQVIPGCEQARQLDETHYEAVMSTKVQFMTVRAHARGTLLETEAPRHMVGELTGEPTAMAGAFRIRLTVDLIPTTATSTTVHYAMDLTLLGRLSSLGEAMVRSTAQNLARQFAANLSKQFNGS